MRLPLPRILVGLLSVIALPAASAKSFIDYFKPIPAQGPLTSDVWGAPGALPRDVKNGLESVANQYCYWDGQILKGPDGRYHIFASRWDEPMGHNGWGKSVAVHGVSENLYGPYLDKGLCWPDDEGGKGHNVTALVLPDGRYAIVISETRPGTVYVSKSLDGPWEKLGPIVTEGETRKRASNYSVMVRPDGDFMIVPRAGQILISKSGILGPYIAQGPSIYPAVAGLEQRNLEDPVVWFSGGLYHIVVNSWSQRKAYHLTSSDGITGWTLRGLAYDPTIDFVRYTDGTVNHWDKLERPGVVLENGHVVAVTLAVLDVPKDQEKGNDRHGNKVIVIPFDGAALDRDLGTPAPAAAIPNLRPGHPRLLATADDWSRLAQRRAAEPDLAAYHDTLIAAATHELTAAPLTYQKTGRRLLWVSRTALQRVLLFSYAWRTTGDERFARRAESEMLVLAAFADWNPSHFLDVGEMTAALALGYDWLYDTLTPAARATIRQAIVDKGLQPGLAVIATGKGWPKTENNWNQVCFGGLALGALAVADEEPATAAAILAAVKADIDHGLKPYAPDGVYPEGPSYWAYGTSYQVLLHAALESALGTDWNLAASPGLLASAGAYLQTTGPTGRRFNFSDGGERADFEPAVFWFAQKLNDPGLLLFERRQLATAKSLSDAVWRNRFSPLAPLWWPRAGTAAAAPTLPLRWTGQGDNPLAVARGSWTDPKAFYLALKGGAAELNHAHMDAGSFIYEAGGVRWAIDLGMQDYESLESKGIDLWNKRQQSQRWTVFRLNNTSHNTLTLDGQPHQVAGHATLRGFEGDGPAVVDLTPVFAGQAGRVQRSFRLLPGAGVAIGDSLAGLKADTEVRWLMATRAEVSLDGRTATLQQDGRRLVATLRAPARATWQVQPADPAPNSYDAPNPGVRFLFFTTPAPADGAVELQVELTPLPSHENFPLCPESVERTRPRRRPRGGTAHAHRAED